MKLLQCTMLGVGTLLIAQVGAFAQDPATQKKVTPRTTPGVSMGMVVMENNTISRRLSPEMVAAIKADFKRANDLLKNAENLLRAGNLPEAEAECRKAMAATGRFNGRIVNTRAHRVLGEVYLAQGRNRDAITTFQECYQYTRDTQIDLGLALAYCRMANYEAAKRVYSDQLVLNHSSLLTSADLPGIGGRKLLEASIRLARGLEFASIGQHEDAIREYSEAEKLAPKNPGIAYLHARSLSFVNRTAEAIPRFAIASVYGKGKIKESSQPYLRSLPEADRKALLQKTVQKAPL